MVATLMPHGTMAGKAAREKCRCACEGARVDRNDLIDEAGRMLRHVVGVLLLAWQRVIRAFLIALVAGVLVGEIGAILQTHRFPPPVLAHVVVMIFATVIAYGVALTVVIDEIIVGIIDTLRLILGEAEAGSRAFEALAMREGSSLRDDVSHLMHGRDNDSGNVSTPDQTARSQEENASQQTMADTEATDAFSNTAPRLAVRPSPVRADQLPRIEWTYHGADDDSVPAGTPQGTPPQRDAGRTVPVTTPGTTPSTAG